MSKVAVVYWSGTGNTEEMAKLVAAGVTAAGGIADMLTPDGFSADKVADYTAFAFGCPSMGAEELEDGEFEPMFSGVKSALSGRKIGLFGSFGWGDGEWMRTWEEDCNGAGLNVIADPVIVSGWPVDDIADACKELGGKLAKA